MNGVFLYLPEEILAQEREVLKHGWCPGENGKGKVLKENRRKEKQEKRKKGKRKTGEKKKQEKRKTGEKKNRRKGKKEKEKQEKRKTVEGKREVKTPPFFGCHFMNYIKEHSFLPW